MNVTAIIPARGGSSLKLKNIRLINDKPLIHYTIESAKRCPLIDNIVVSTDNVDIKEQAVLAGASVPFLRPKNISTNTATTESALTHCVNRLIKMDMKPDIVVYLSCAQPFRKDKWLRECIHNLLDNSSVDSSFVAYKCYKNYWYDDGLKLYWKQYCNRQTRRPILEENTGAVCATRVEVIERGDRIGDNTMVVPVDGINLEIHTEADSVMAEAILSKDEFTF